MIDVTITITRPHDHTACDLLEFLSKVLGSKANNRLLGFDLSLIGEWILFEEITGSVVVRVKKNYY